MLPGAVFEMLAERSIVEVQQDESRHVGMEGLLAMFAQGGDGREGSASHCW